MEEKVPDNLRNLVDHYNGSSPSIPPIPTPREINPVEEVNNQEAVEAITVIARARRKVKKKAIGILTTAKAGGLIVTPGREAVILASLIKRVERQKAVKASWS